MERAVSFYVAVLIDGKDRRFSSIHVSEIWWPSTPPGCHHLEVMTHTIRVCISVEGVMVLSLQ